MGSAGGLLPLFGDRIFDSENRAGQSAGLSGIYFALYRFRLLSGRLFIDRDKCINSWIFFPDPVQILIDQFRHTQLTKMQLLAGSAEITHLRTRSEEHTSELHSRG